jgi:hypothetical protein
VVASPASSRTGGDTGRNPTDRGKLGVKRHILTDQRGVPISVVQREEEEERAENAGGDEIAAPRHAERKEEGA